MQKIQIGTFSSNSINCAKLQCKYKHRTKFDFFLPIKSSLTGSTEPQKIIGTFYFSMAQLKSVKLLATVILRKFFKMMVIMKI